MNYKMTSQYKWYHNRLFFHLFSAFIWLVVIILIFLLTIFDLKKIAFFFLIYGCIVIVMFCGTIITYYGIKLLNISKDNYQTKEVKVVNVYEISARKIELIILTEAQVKKKIIIYKIFLDSSISLKQNTKINVLEGNSNILI